MGNVSRFRLQQEKEVAVFLRFFVIGEEALLQVGCIFEVAGDLVLLSRKTTVSLAKLGPVHGKTYLLKCHTVLDQQSDPRIQVAHVLFQYKVLLGLTGYLCLIVTLDFLG